MIKSRTDEEIKDYIVVYLDVLRFKVINDVFGSGKGDELLIHIAGVISGAVKDSGLGCRIGSDRFLLLAKCPDEQMENFITDIFEKIAEFELSFEITCNAGIYKSICRVSYRPCYYGSEIHQRQLHQTVCLLY